MERWVDPIPALKQRVAAEILVLTEGWSQHFAASFMRLPQSRVSDLRRGQIEHMTLDRLLRCLSRLDRGIAIDTWQARPSMHPHRKVDRKPPDGAGE